MESITFSLFDMIQLFLMLGACYACNRWGYHRGIGDTIQFFDKQGILELEEPEVEPEPKAKPKSKK